MFMFRLGKKFVPEGTPPPPRNSKKLLWPRGGRYASCVHAGGLSCLGNYFDKFSNVLGTKSLLQEVQSEPLPAYVLIMNNLGICYSFFFGGGGDLVFLLLEMFWLVCQQNRTAIHLHVCNKRK